MLSLPMLSHLVSSMAHSPVHNYVIPGLTSWLIGGLTKDKGIVRMFTMSREHEEPILPHSHRFDFYCIVLEGQVRNRIWTPCNEGGDLYQVSTVTYEGEFGKHETKPLVQQHFRYVEKFYSRGDAYCMSSEQLHSIYFSKGAKVLFFEGPPVSDLSEVLEPVVNSEVIPLFRTDPWMFKKG